MDGKVVTKVEYKNMQSSPCQIYRFNITNPRLTEPVLFTIKRNPTLTDLQT